MKPVKLMAAAVGALVLAGMTTQARAETAEARRPENRADLQCLAVFAAVAGLDPEDAELQSGAVGALMYYSGRLNGRAPTVDWLEELKQFILSDIDEGFKVEAERCGREMIQLGAEMTAWGAEMQALGAKMEDSRKRGTP
jgi:hypothetical protein